MGEGKLYTEAEVTELMNQLKGKYEELRRLERESSRLVAEHKILIREILKKNGLT
jgi:hypothetical protein